MMASLPLLLAPAARNNFPTAKKIGGKFMCMCNCSQAVTQCNHLGCMTAAAIPKELSQAVSRGKSEDVITQTED